MSTSTQQIVLLELKANAKQAIAEYDRLKQEAMELKRADELVKAAGDEHKESLVRQKHALQDAAEEAKKAKSAMKDMEQALKDNANSANSMNGMFDKLASSIAKGSLAASAIQKGLELAKDAVIGLVKAGLEYEDNVGSLGPKVRDFSRALNNLVPDEAIARTYELGKAQGWTEEQTLSVLKASVEYGRITRTDTKEAVQLVTDAVVNGKSPALRKLGIDFNLTGTASDKMNAILKTLNSTYKDSTLSAEDASEATDAFSNKLESLTGRLGQSIVKSKAFGEALDFVARMLDQLDLMVYQKEGNFEDIVQTRIHKIGNLADTTKYAIQLQAKLAEARLLRPDEKINTDLELSKEEQKIAEKNLKKNLDARKKASSDYAKHEKEIEKKAVEANKAVLKMKETLKSQDKKLYADRLSIQRKYENDAHKSSKAFQKKITDSERDTAAKNKELKAEYMENLKEYYRQEATLIADQIAMNIINAKSFEDFTRKTLATAITALGQKASFHAMGEAAAALAALALTWGVPNQASAGHFASAAGWTALAIAANAGSGLIANAISGSSGGSISSDMVGGNMNKDYSGFRESSSEFNSPNSRGSYSQGGSQTNVYIKGRMPLMSRRELKSIMGKLNSGRVA